MKKKIFKIIVSTLFLFSFNAYSYVELGAGMTSAFGGRNVPALMGGVGSIRWHLSAFSTGVQNSFYYQSTYGLNFFRIWPSGQLLNSHIISGFGLGTSFSSRVLQDTGSLVEEEKSDFSIGPAFRVQWFPFHSVYLNIEWIFGVRNLGLLLSLNSQDLVQLSLGVRI